jgi:hypothetical protein
MGFACVSAEAWAKPFALELDWNAPEGCPSAENVLAAIHQLMGAPEVQGAPTLSVRGDIERHAAALTLKLGWRTDSMQAERTMESSSCDELARAAALVVALAADPGAIQAPPADAASQPLQAAESAMATEKVAPEQAATASKAQPARVQPSSFVMAQQAEQVDSSSPSDLRPDTSTAARLTASAKLALDVGSLPHTAEGVALGFGWRQGPAAIQAEAALYLPQHKSVTEGSAQLWLGTFSARPCFSWSFARLRLAPCAVVELDLLVGQGEGIDFRQRGAAWFPRFGGGVGLGYPLSRQIAWITEGWLLAAPWRPTFVIQDVVPVHRPNQLAGRWTTGLELRL